MTARISLILREARAHRARLQLLFRSEDQLRHRKPCGITLNSVRGVLAPRWGADSYWNHHPGVTLAALANPRLISRHASGVAKTAKLQRAVIDRPYSSLWFTRCARPSRLPAPQRRIVHRQG